MSDRRVKWKISRKGDTTKLGFAGDVTEGFPTETVLAEVAQQPAGPVVMNCRSIRRINSEGTRRLVDLVRRLCAMDQVTDVLYKECSVALVSQLNMIPALLESPKIRVLSLYAPYVFEVTGEEQDHLLEVKEIGDVADPPIFEHSSGDGFWELDEDPTRYFAFLEGRPNTSGSD